MLESSAKQIGVVVVLLLMLVINKRAELVGIAVLKFRVHRCKLTLNRLLNHDCSYI